MRHLMTTLLTATLLSLQVPSVLGQDLRFELQQAVEAKNWNRAIELADKLIEANPQEAPQLREYKTQLQNKIPWRNPQLLRTLKARGAVYAAALSPDGKTLVTGGSKTLEVWNIETGQSKFLLDWIPNKFKKLTYIITSIAIDPSGLYIITNSNGAITRSTTQDCTSSSGEVSFKFSCSLSWGSGSSQTTSGGEVISWTLNRGSTSTTYTRAGRVQLWNLQTGEQVHTTPANISNTEIKEMLGKSDRTTPAFSPDRQVRASVTNGNTIQLFDTRNEQLLATLSGHTDVQNNRSLSISFLGFSPDGKTLISAGTDGTIKIWGAP